MRVALLLACVAVTRGLPDYENAEHGLWSLAELSTAEELSERSSAELSERSPAELSDSGGPVVWLGLRLGLAADRRFARRRLGDRRRLGGDDPLGTRAGGCTYIESKAQLVAAGGKGQT